MLKLVYVVSYVENYEDSKIGGVFTTKELAEQCEKNLREQHGDDNGFYAGINEVEMNVEVNALVELYR